MLKWLYKIKCNLLYFGYFGIKYSIYAKDNIKNNIVCEVCGVGEGKIKLEKILKKIRAV
jgi:hypothetical protein